MRVCCLWVGDLGDPFVCRFDGWMVSEWRVDAVRHWTWSRTLDLKRERASIGSELNGYNPHLFQLFNFRFRELHRLTPQGEPGRSSMDPPYESTGPGLEAPAAPVKMSWLRAGLPAKAHGNPLYCIASSAIRRKRHAHTAVAPSGIPKIVFFFCR